MSWNHNVTIVEVDQEYNFPNNTDTNYIFHTSGSGTGDGYTTLRSKHHSTPINEPIYIFKSPFPPYNDTSYQVPRPFKFTTAILFGKYNFKYCYVEMSFRTNGPSAASPYNAYAPNFWMWAADSTAAYSEIDISEMEGRNWTTAPCMHYRHFPNLDTNGTFIPPPSGYTDADTAYWNANDFWDTSTYVPYLRYHTPVNTPFTTGNWHTIGCEWTPDYIDIYYYTLSADTFLRFSANKFPPIKQLCAMPIIIDNYTPAPRDSFLIPFNPINTQMPFNYDIDYVRVYQVKQHCISKTFLNTSSATYADTLWQNLTIGGSGGSAIFNSGNHHLAANDFILLQEGFEVSGTGTVLINTMSCQSDQSMDKAAAPPNPPKPLSIQLKTDIKNRHHNE